MHFFTVERSAGWQRLWRGRWLHARHRDHGGNGHSHSLALLLAVALLAASLGFWNLSSATDGLSVTHSETGGTPVTIFQKEDTSPAPVVVVAHGFAGSQQLMQPFAISLARSGYVVVTYDLLGHGRNPMPLTGDVTKVEGATANLVRQLGDVVAFAGSLPASDGRQAMLGHSMATDVLVRYAAAHPEVSATIAVSMFSPAVTATTPKNLLVIVGGLETGLRDEALRAVGLAADGAAKEGVTYGDLGNGSARRVSVAHNVEHVGVLYSGESLKAARDWLNLVFGRTVAAPVERRGVWLALYFLGITVTAWFAARLLPRVVEPAVGADASWGQVFALATVPAVLTPLLLWKAPVDVLPVPVGGYLAAHFLLFGLLTGCGLIWLQLFRGRGMATVLPGRAILPVIAVVAACGLAFYLPIDAFVTSFHPTSSRWHLVAAMAIGLMPYFLADEWLTRGTDSRRGAYLFTKLCFLMSLVVAIALNLEDLFFLIIIVPVVLVFFTIFGLISSWVYGRTGHPAVGAIANAMLFAWAIAVTFPMLGH